MAAESQTDEASGLQDPPLDGPELDEEGSRDENGTVDQDGIPITRYAGMVLVVLPPTGFGEQALRFVRSSLANVNIGTRAASTEYDDSVKGRLQDEFLVDEQLAGLQADNLIRRDPAV